MAVRTIVERSPDDVLIFDVGGTLIRTPSDLMVARFARSLEPPVDPDVLGRAFESTLTSPPLEISTVEDHMTWWTQEYSRVLHAAGYRGDHQTAIDEMWSMWLCPGELYPDALPTLRALASRGQRLSVISNWAPPLEQSLTALGIHELFEVVVCSSLVRIRKPHPEIFRHAARALGVSTERCVYIGDSFELDVQGALSAGMRAVLVDRDGLHACGPRAPYRVIDSLHALLADTAR